MSDDPHHGILFGSGLSLCIHAFETLTVVRLRLDNLILNLAILNYY